MHHHHRNTTPHHTTTTCSLHHHRSPLLSTAVPDVGMYLSLYFSLSLLPPFSPSTYSNINTNPLPPAHHVTTTTSYSITAKPPPDPPSPPPLYQATPLPSIFFCRQGRIHILVKFRKFWILKLENVCKIRILIHENLRNFRFWYLNGENTFSESIMLRKTHFVNAQLTYHTFW